MSNNKMSDLEAKIEAILIMSSESITAKNILNSIQNFPLKDKNTTLEEVVQALDNLVKKYSKSFGFILQKTSLGYRFYTSPKQKDFVKNYLQNIQTEQPLSISALETLAIVAYKGPVNRVQINSIRGVKSDSTIRTLQLRNLISEKSSADASGASSYEVTNCFLEKLGLSNVSELAPLAPYLPDNFLPENFSFDDKII
ncbi:MAG: SMC-Scp complex subunit ScpB [Bifidobacteriaceae bacterium]|jgi:segregation and condensation protein B|nr:SMC-Scp complex subunit ScpB [Bifidobacteriaceae bacterium]